MNPFVAFWHTNPVFRILIFYLSGLLVSDKICQTAVAESGIFPNLLWGFGGVILILLIALMLKGVHKCNLCFGRPYNGILFLVFFFVLGMFMNTCSWHKGSQGWSGKGGVYAAILLEEPQITERTIRSEAVLVAWLDSAGYTPIKRRVQLNFLRSPKSEALSVGDQVCFRAVIHAPAVNGNPGSFDYARYLLRKGIQGTAFLQENVWMKSSADDFGRSDALSFMDRLRIKFLAYRCRMVRQLARDGLEGEGYALFAALALGDKSGLSDEMENIYKESGTSHILALSGMHLSVLLNVFYFLFLRRLQYNRWRWLFAMPVILLIWGYTFIAGLPVSLLRAAWMSSLGVLGLLSNRRSFTLNILFWAAMVMLLINPFAFYDVGFQLSFAAVLAILFLQNRFMLLFPRSNGLKKEVFQMLAVSFAAQVGTIPLVVYYFQHVSVVSSLATLVVSPLTAVLLYLFPLYLLLGWWDVFRSVWVPVVSWLSSLQNDLLEWFSNLPWASLKGCSLSVCGVIVCYVLIALLVSYRQSYRSYRVLGMLVCCFMLLYEVIGHYERKKIMPQLIFYNNPSAPAIHFIDAPHHSYLLLAADASGESLEKMNYIRRDFWDPMLKHTPEVVTAGFSDSLLYYRNGFLLSANFSILVLSDATWNTIPSCCRQNYTVDYIYVCRGYYGNLPDLHPILHPRVVVLDRSLSDNQRRRYQEQCDGLGWSCYDMYRHGALKVALK